MKKLFQAEGPEGSSASSSSKKRLPTIFQPEPAEGEDDVETPNFLGLT